MEARAIGIDVGGTKIAGVRVTAAGVVEARATAGTPAGDQERTFEAIVRIAEELASSGVRAVGVGAAGLVTWPDGVIRFAPNNAWREFPLRERLAGATGLPCVVDNDAAAAALGEHRYGAGRGVGDLLLVTVGTGIGGGIIAGGRPFRGAHGFAAEIGHVIVEPGGPRCGCGNLGCWEQVASGTAIERAGRAAVRERPGSLLASLAGGDPERVDGALVTRAAREGDEVAVAILAEVGRRLGEGIAGLVNILDPELVIVGGGAVDAGELLLGPARRACAEAVEAREHRPEVPVVPAALGPEAGAVGAAALALDEAGA